MSTHPNSLKITDFCHQVSNLGYIKGVEDCLVNAAITFDRFHVIKLLNKAVDKVRKEERMREPILKSTRYIWLKNPKNLTVKQTETLNSLSKLKLKTARAYCMRLVFQDIFTLPFVKAIEALKSWYGWAVRSRLEAIKNLQRC